MLFQDHNPFGATVRSRVGASSNEARCSDAGDKFKAGVCSLRPGSPILIGGDNQQLVNQQSSVGAFGVLDCNNLTPTGHPSSTLPPGQIPPGFTLTCLLSFSASCCWRATGLYFTKSFVDRVTAAGARASLIGLYAGSGYNDNSLGFQQSSTNLIPLDLLSDPRQNCCPLFNECDVEAGSPYVIQFTIESSALLPLPTDGAQIEAAMFGFAKPCDHRRVPSRV